MMNSNKLYGLVNRVLLGFLAFDCMGNKCRLVSIPVAGYDIPILQIIVVLKLVTFNLHFMNVIMTLNNQRTARVPFTLNYKPTLVAGSNSSETPGHRHSKAHRTNPEPVDSPELVEYRNRMQTEIRELRLQTMIMMTWSSVLEYLAFYAAAYTTPEYRNELAIAGILLNSYQAAF